MYIMDTYGGSPKGISRDTIILFTTNVRTRNTWDSISTLITAKASAAKRQKIKDANPCKIYGWSRVYTGRKKKKSSVQNSNMLCMKDKES